ncbi:MAG: FAD-binding protein [Nostocoides sp.]
MERLTGWGRSLWSRSEVAYPATVEAVAEAVTSAGRRGVLTRGLGRAYGDAALNAGGSVLRLNHMSAIGPISPDGVITLDAGVVLDDLIRHALPQGWFVPVTPGTAHVSVGGAVAADVHGKNHHAVGSFGQHLAWVEVVDGRGRLRRLQSADPLLGAVIAGMGLTGVITRVGLRLRPVTSPLMTVRTTRTTGLEQTMAVLSEDDTRFPYTVAWIDTLTAGAAMGRGIVTSGNHTDGAAARATVAVPRAARTLPGPPWAPAGLLNRTSIRAFNGAYYRHGPRHPRTDEQTIGAFFHPLDVIDGWNRLYGPRGFLQYQVVVPDPHSIEALMTLLQRAHVLSFLAVLKRFGPSYGAPLSFPIPGWTLALDIPVSNGIHATLDAADDLVVSAGGRTYFAKDSRLRPELVPVMYPQLEHWRALRADLDPDGVFVSDLARRLSLC